MARMKQRKRRWTRPLGLVLGACAVLATLASFRVPGGSEDLGANVTMVATPGGELRVDPAEPFLVVGNMLPNDPIVTESLTLHNITGVALDVHLTSSVKYHGLDRFLMVKITEPGSTIFEGYLENLVAEPPKIRVEANLDKEVKVSVSLPIMEKDEEISNELAGQSADIEIKLEAQRSST